MTVLVTIPKNAREEVRVTLAEYRGHRFADVRVYAQREDGETVPTPKGVAVKPAALPALIDALRAALVVFKGSEAKGGADDAQTRQEARWRRCPVRLVAHYLLNSAAFTTLSPPVGSRARGG